MLFFFFLMIVVITFFFFFLFFFSVWLGVKDFFLVSVFVYSKKMHFVIVDCKDSY